MQHVCKRTYCLPQRESICSISAITGCEKQRLTHALIAMQCWNTITNSTLRVLIRTILENTVKWIGFFSPCSYSWTWCSCKTHHIPEGPIQDIMNRSQRPCVQWPSFKAVLLLWRCETDHCGHGKSPTCIFSLHLYEQTKVTVLTHAPYTTGVRFFWLFCRSICFQTKPSDNIFPKYLVFITSLPFSASGLVS